VLGDPPPSGTVRDKAHEILGRPEFHRQESLVQKVLGWFGDQLAKLQFGLGGGPGFLGTLFALLIIGAVGYAIVMLVRSLRFGGRRRRPTIDLTIDEEERRAAADWRRDAERFEAEGEWREAMRARYRELVRVLVDDGVLADIAGRTTGEYREELARSRPATAAEFAEATDLFEAAWYGGRSTSEEQYRRFRTLAAAVRDARREPVPA
jgi:hypothetical protein